MSRDEAKEKSARLPPLKAAKSKRTSFAGLEIRFSVRPVPRKIILPPGHTLVAIARFLLTRAAFKEYVEPLIADMQEEYFQDIVAGREWRARWIAARVWLLVIPGWLYALVASKLAGLLRRRP